MTLRPLILLLALLACGRGQPPPAPAPTTVARQASLFAQWAELDGARRTAERGEDMRGWAALATEIPAGSGCEVTASVCSSPLGTKARIRVTSGPRAGASGWVGAAYLSPDPCTQSPPR